jgi:hypothetical protein
MNNIIKRQQQVEAVLDDYDVQKCQEHAICLICVSLTYFPEPSFVLASMFYHFEPDIYAIYML